MRNDTMSTSVLDFLAEYYGDGPDIAGKMNGVSYPIVSAGKLYIAGDTLKGEEDIVVDLPTVLAAKNRQSIMTQADMLVFDILASSSALGWTRPVYFANTVPDSYYLGLDPYMYVTGMARQVLPRRSGALYKANNLKAYENIMERFRWGGLDAEGGDDVYLDETVSRMVASTRYAIIEVIESLYRDGEYDKALNLLNLMIEKLPTKNAPYGIQAGANIADLFLALAEASGNEQARAQAEQIYRDEIGRFADYIPYLASLSPSQFASLNTADRAVLHIVDSNGNYSYLGTLISNYIQSFGVDSAQEFLLGLSAEKGFDLIDFYNRLNTPS